MSEKHEKNYKSVWQGCIYLARAVGVPVSRHSGCRLATTLVARINVIIFFLRCDHSHFLIEGVLGSKNLFSES